MKVFLCVVLCGLVAMCCAEPPRFRSSRLRSKVLSRQEVAPAADPAPASASGPYPPSGWQPEGETLELPTEQTEAPVAEYGPPANEYGPPALEYGPAAPADEPSAEEPLADNPEAEAVAVAVDQNGRLILARQRAASYVVIPASALQRIQIAPQRVAPAKLGRARFF